MTNPKAFVGNRSVTERLTARLESGRLPHALVFAGPQGVGKRTYARSLIQALNCPDAGSHACGNCYSCQKIERGSHPDVTEISIEGDASQIKIEQIRRLRETLILEPGEGAVRASIIDEADRMTPGAANALLKALEEPPPRTFFFLITSNPNDLLVTIRSRCQTYHFAPLSLDAIRDLGITDELVARWSQGSLGRALDADPEVLRQNRDQMFDFIESGLTGGAEGVADLLGRKLAPSRDDHIELLRAGYFLLSDMLRMKLGLDNGLVNVDIVEQLKALSATVSTDSLVAAAGQLAMIEGNLRRYLNPQLMTDAALVSLAASAGRGK